jgi:hypothetical protein
MVGILEIALENFNKAFKNSVSDDPSAAHQWLDNAKTQGCWDDHPEASILREWAGEIGRAAESQDRSCLELAGINIVVAQDDQSDFREVVRLLADTMKLRAAFIPAIDIRQILPDIRAALAPIAPALVMLEGGDWCGDGPGNDDSFSSDGGIDTGKVETQKKEFSVIAELLKDFNPDRPIYLLLGLRDISCVSDALCQRGAFDRFIVVGNKPKEKLGKEFCDAIGQAHVGTTISSNPGKLGILIQNEFQTKERRELAALHLTRLAHKLDRKIEFSDVVDLVLRGFVEFGSEVERQLKDINRRKTACHEAGHAAIAIIESGGRNVPEYASIIPAKNFSGVVLESLEFVAQQNEFTFSDLLLKVRVSLAGRAAEEFFFSSTDVSSGADSDLSYATNIAFHFFAYSGFHRSMDQSHFSGKNLAVISFGGVDSIQRERINSEVRLFLAEQYELVLSKLKTHASFVKSIADRLMWDPVVDQFEMIDICREFNIPAEPAYLTSLTNPKSDNWASRTS